MKLGGLITFLTGAAVWAAGHLNVLPAVHGTTASVITAAGAVASIFGARAAIKPTNALATVAALDILPRGVKTVLGGALALITYLLSPDVVGVLSPKLASILMTISAILIALGVTHVAAVNAVTPVPKGGGV